VDIHSLAQKEICCEKEKLRHALQRGDFDELQKIDFENNRASKNIKRIAV
jgi:hypothetical protein